MIRNRGEEIIGTVLIGVMAFLAGEQIPELSAVPVVAFQTSAFASSLSWSLTLSLPDNMQIRFD